MNPTTTWTVSVIRIRDILSKVSMQYAKVAPLAPLESFVSSAKAELMKSFGKCCYLECRVF